MHPDTHAQIIEILDTVNDLTLATVRPDGFPQATTVSFVHDDLTLYFGTFRGGQKAQNITACDKVSATVNKPYDSWQQIEGLSLGGHAGIVTDPDEIARVTAMLLDRFPQAADYEPDTPDTLAVVRIDPVVISLLDYTKGFGHTEEIEIQPRLAAPD